MTPAELDAALQDFDETQFTSMRRICEMLRVVAIQIWNTAPGMDKSKQYRNPKRFMKFEWETPDIQSVDEMKSFLMSLSHMEGVEVKQNGEKVDPFEESKELKRTK